MWLSYRTQGNGNLWQLTQICSLTESLTSALIIFSTRLFPMLLAPVLWASVLRRQHGSPYYLSANENTEAGGPTGLAPHRTSPLQAQWLRGALLQLHLEGK